MRPLTFTNLFLFQRYIVDSGNSVIVSFSVIDWLMEHRTADSIEEVTEEMLVAVSFLTNKQFSGDEHF